MNEGKGNIYKKISILFIILILEIIIGLIGYNTIIKQNSKVSSNKNENEIKKEVISIAIKPIEKSKEYHGDDRTLTCSNKEVLKKILEWIWDNESKISVYSAYRYTKDEWVKKRL